MAVGPRRQLGAGVGAGVHLQIDEAVGDVDQVGGGLARRRRHLHAQAGALRGVDQADEVAVAADDDRHVDVRRLRQQVDRQLHVEVGLRRAVVVAAQQLGPHAEPVAAEPGDEAVAVLVVRRHPQIRVGPLEAPLADQELEQPRIVDADAHVLGREVEVRHVEEDGDPIKLVPARRHVNPLSP